MVYIMNLKIFSPLNKSTCVNKVPIVMCTSTIKLVSSPERAGSGHETTSTKLVSCPDPTPHTEEKGSGYNTTSCSTQ